MPDIPAAIPHAICLTLAGRCHDVEWARFSAADWLLLGEVAETEGVAPLLCHVLDEQGWPASAPEEAQCRLRRALYTSMAADLVMQQELGRVVALLHAGRALDDGMPAVVVLKGGALGRSLYPSPGLRPYSDLDLLVPREQWQAAVTALGSLGYRPDYGSIPERSAGINAAIGYHLPLRGGPGNGTTVELHWALLAGEGNWSSPALDWFWTQTEECAPSFVQLAPTAQLLYLAAHAVLRHGRFARLIWFYDLHLLIERWGDRLDWDELLLRAREFHWADALATALEATRQRFGTPLPEGFVEALRQDADDAARRLVTLKTGGLQTRTRRLWANLLAMPWHARLHLLAVTLWPSAAFLRWRYRPQPEWLWPLLYPYRWLDIVADGIVTLVKMARRRVVER